MGKGSYFAVFFNGAISIEDAERALRASNMTITRTEDQLAARWGTGPELYMGVSAESHVILEAQEVAEQHDVAGLASCDRRFEVAFDDLEAVLDETNTLFQIGATLQELTNGYIHNSWNGSLLLPGGEPCKCRECS
jgi:hypothetical protein